MTITFPRSFPSGLDRFSGCDFNLLRQEAANSTYGGQFTGMELADAVWTCKYKTIDLWFSDRAIWQAWYLSLKGVLNAFYGYDPEKPYPLYYGAAVLNLTRYVGGTFDGTATVTSNTSSAVTMSKLPVSYRFSIGDLISLPMADSQRSLHQVMEAVTGDSTGNATVTVEPNIRSGVQTTALGIQLVKPTCVMVVKPGTFSAPAVGGDLQPVTFEAVQKLA